MEAKKNDVGGGNGDDNMNNNNNNGNKANFDENADELNNNLNLNESLNSPNQDALRLRLVRTANKIANEKHRLREEQAYLGDRWNKLFQAEEVLSPS